LVIIDRFFTIFYDIDKLIALVGKLGSGDENKLYINLMFP